MKKEQEYNEILSMVTHDLKSPLTAVMGAFDMLSLGDLSEKEKEYNINQGKKASKSILHLVETILIMAKSEAGKEKCSFAEVNNLKEHFEDIVDTFKFESKIKDIKVSLKIKDNLPIVYWDMDKIHYHVINNIISNSLKFTPHKGKIVISISEDKSDIVIHVMDNGIGMDKNKRRTIFDKYDTHEDKKVFKGTGLGLYNAYNFVTQHNGNIEVTDGLKGKGIGFKITLPIGLNNCI
jgi:signal transduction histidine kinase